MSHIDDFLGNHNAKVQKLNPLPATKIIRSSNSPENIHTLIVLLDDAALDQIRQIIREEIEASKK